ncbi:uncharacterized protein C2orf81 homolog [Bombina bombina]|uniref:uncharacterized protein C2orf81 homolog n=1 Tax=Bombina bombina TaxID=8345 RepID=UPI00235A87BB|nr:uncharacterized protein C2orf81 homolog [Bombina bombina]
MSRAKPGPGQAGTRASLSKSRVEKSRSATAAPVPPVIVEIVPGQLTEEDWVSIVIQEDDEDLGAEILEALQSQVMEECCKVYVTCQEIPYTSSQASDIMTLIIQWAFISRDEGELELAAESTWQDEEEPLPSLYESWHTGCPTSPRWDLTLCQRQNMTSTWHSASNLLQDDLEETISQKEEHEFEPREAITKAQLTCPTPQPDAPSTHEQKNEAKEIHDVTPMYQTSQTTVQLVPSQNIPRRRYQPHTGPLRSAGLKNITKSLADTEKDIFMEQQLKVIEKENKDGNFSLIPPSLHNILKIQKGRPPQKNVVVYDEFGNILSVPKLDPSILSHHRIFPQVEVLNPINAESKVKKAPHVVKPAAISRPKLKRRPNVDTAGLPSLDFQKQTPGDNLSEPFTSFTAVEETILPISSAIGINLDSMQLNSGVILKMSNHPVSKSLSSFHQREKGQREETGELKPIQDIEPLPSIKVSQLIRNNVPQVCPISRHHYQMLSAGFP